MHTPALPAAPFNLPDKGCCLGATPARLLQGDISLPAAVLHLDALEHNLAWMQAFANANGAWLAPHGKTTMAPGLFHRQLAAGAWGITVATAQQAHVAAAHGVPRILVANQIVGRANFILLSEAMARYGARLHCLVDSVENVQALGRHFQGQRQRLDVLVEVGVAGGRCGCRDRAAVQAVVAAVQAEPALRLAGIETYEGVIHGAQAEAQVRAHLEQVRALCLELLAAEAFESHEVLLSGAGSAWYDIAAQVFGAGASGRIRPLLRPGCYLIHDEGLCMHAQQALVARRAAPMPPGDDLRSSLELWAHVQSRPEPGLAIIAMGKRDVAFDAGLPMPRLHHRPGTPGPVAAGAGWRVVSMMDQHASMAVPVQADLRVGDLVGFSTSHPCLTFDKWRQVHLVDADYRVLETLRTWF